MREGVFEAENFLVMAWWWVRRGYRYFFRLDTFFWVGHAMLEKEVYVNLQGDDFFEGWNISAKYWKVNGGVVCKIHILFHQFWTIDLAWINDKRNEFIYLPSFFLLNNKNKKIFEWFWFLYSLLDCRSLKNILGQLYLNLFYGWYYEKKIRGLAGLWFLVLEILEKEKQEITSLSYLNLVKVIVDAIKYWQTVVNNIYLKGKRKDNTFLLLSWSKIGCCWHPFLI